VKQWENIVCPDINIWRQKQENIVVFCRFKDWMECQFCEIALPIEQQIFKCSTGWHVYMIQKMSEVLPLHEVNQYISRQCHWNTSVFEYAIHLHYWWCARCIGQFPDCCCNCLGERRWEGRPRSHLCKPIASVCHMTPRCEHALFLHECFFNFVFCLTVMDGKIEQHVCNKLAR
jgi:hypothetical protein